MHLRRRLTILPEAFAEVGRRDWDILTLLPPFQLATVYSYVHMIVKATSNQTFYHWDMPTSPR